MVYIVDTRDYVTISETKRKGPRAFYIFNYHGQIILFYKTYDTCPTFLKNTLLDKTRSHATIIFSKKHSDNDILAKI